jgi:hypothetical protein
MAVVAKRASGSAAGSSSTVASNNITQRIKDLGGWRGEMLARLVPRGRRLHGRSVQAGREAHVFRGASLADPGQLFNSSLEGNVRRAIDFRESEKVNEAAFKTLIKAAVAANSAARSKRAPRKK